MIVREHDLELSCAVGLFRCLIDLVAQILCMISGRGRSNGATTINIRAMDVDVLASTWNFRRVLKFHHRYTHFSCRLPGPSMS